MLLQGVRGTDETDFIPILFANTQTRVPRALTTVVSHSNTPVSPTTTTHTTVSNFSVWHHRLGHDNLHAVKTVLDLCKTVVPADKMFVLCKSCAIGKSHRTHLPPTNTVYTTPFE